jgi:hypothetical protein
LSLINAISEQEVSVEPEVRQSASRQRPSRPGESDVRA